MEISRSALLSRVPTGYGHSFVFSQGLIFITKFNRIPKD